MTWPVATSSVLRLGLVLALATSQVAAKKADETPLDRMKPVPADEEIPIIDFFRPPVFTAPELNPAGTHFAALVSTRTDRQDIAVFDLATNRIERLTGGDDYDIATFDWLNDKRLLFSITYDKLYASGLYNAELGRLTRAFPIQLHNVTIPVAYPRSNPLHVVLWIKHSATENGADGGIYKVDLRREPEPFSGAIRIGNRAELRVDVVERYPQLPTGAPAGYIAGPDGELAYATSVKDGRYTLLRLDGREWNACPVDLDSVEVLATSDRPGELLVREPRQDGRPRAVRRLDTRSGEIGEVVFTDDEYDFDDARVVRHPADGRILGVHYSRKGPSTLWIDADFEAIQETLQSKFPNQIVRIFGSDRAEKQFFFRTISDVSPSTYYHIDLERKTFHLVANSAPWIDPARMQPMRLFTYKARDGCPIDAYLTLPAGASKTPPPPLVVLPHGGPWVRDTWRWDPEVQFLASRGFAVFQPNYRGSDGTTWRFPPGDPWNFRKMHDDVTDGVQLLVRSDLVDRERLAIMGASFGGFLALCGAAFEPDLYRCAITIAGVFDWEQMMKEDRRSVYRRDVYGVRLRNLGDPKTEKERFEEISPLRAVDRIKIPVFVAHGSEDVVVSVNQSRRLVAALKQHGVPHETQIERKEGHGFHKLDNEVQLYGEIERFLGQHLAPRPFPSPAAAGP